MDYGKINGLTCRAAYKTQQEILFDIRKIALAGYYMEWIIAAVTRSHDGSFLNRKPHGKSAKSW